MKQQFDLFGEGEVREPEMKAQAPSTHDMRDLADEIEMVRCLEETGRYRVLRKLEPRAAADAPRPGFPLRGVIVDTETTGLNARKDEIIEIGIVAFSFDAAGNIGDVTGIYGGLRQPSVAIPADITRLPGEGKRSVKIPPPLDDPTSQAARFEREHGDVQSSRGREG